MGGRVGEKLSAKGAAGPAATWPRSLDSARHTLPNHLIFIWRADEDAQKGNFVSCLGGSLSATPVASITPHHVIDTPTNLKPNLLLSTYSHKYT